MSERIVSPGVFTQERDLSFLEQGVSQIGAAFVGPTLRGPAFIPTAVDGINEFVTKFGEATETSYVGYTVKNYLREAGTATVVRVLGLSGYAVSSSLIYATGSSGSKLFAVLHPTARGQNITSVTLAGTTGSFNLIVSASGASVSASALSAVESATAFITNYFGTSPVSASTLPAYVYAVFPDALTQAGGSVTLSATASATALNFLGEQYANASTPWVQSQTIAGVKHNLFKVHTLSDGVAANSHIKISILGIAPSTNPDSDFGTFTLVVRDINDTDASTNVLEQFDNLNLNPESSNYIARRIGNSAPVYDSVTNETYYEGDFANISDYIRVEMAEGNSIPDSALPYGFAAIASVVNASSNLTTASFVTSRWLSGSTPGWSATAVDKRYFYGFDYSDTTALAFLQPTFDISVGSAFSLEDLGVEVPSGSSAEAISLTNSSHVGYRRFTVPLQGGFDGMSPTRIVAMGESIVPSNTQGFDLTNSTSAGSVAYKRALDALANPDQFDFNLLVLPGVIFSQHSYVAQAAIDMCEAREDCFYIMDLDTIGATVSSAVAQAATIDSNYVAAYYPWIRVLDTNTNRLIWAPPSTVLPEVFAYNDNNAAEWFAPAGLNRGGIPGAVGVKVRLSQAQRDVLYEGRVNPIAMFPRQGITAWGQKTLQRRESALDRINVRRLLLAVKKYIASSSRYLVFEQNVESTRNKFLNMVNPYLAGIQQRSGLYAFRVVMDETNNTADLIDRNILRGDIYLQPTRTAEVIKLNFNVLPTGASFDSI